MKNNKGLGRFETIIIVLLLLVVFAFLFKVLLDSVSGEDFTAMREDAISFGKTVNTNANFYHDSSIISLGEAIGEKTIKKIKNPVGSGYCDETESKAVMDGDKYLITLRCGDYLIEKEPITKIDKAKIYKVSEWQEKEIEGAEKTTLYNCKDNDKEVYPEYYDEAYFVYKINQDYQEEHYAASDVSTSCTVLTKDVYRTKEEYKEK
ncbi:MAG: hypothetical protein IKE63_02205 [Bacilli bacterium]|nr:hypothetical protein [Bacilli bacterium]